jgi:hypothetical protein
VSHHLPDISPAYHAAFVSKNAAFCTSGSDAPQLGGASPARDHGWPDVRDDRSTLRPNANLVLVVVGNAGKERLGLSARRRRQWLAREQLIARVTEYARVLFLAF